MALPTSGPLTFSQIGAALSPPASAPYSLRAMSATAGKSTPDSVSEFYGYSAVTYILGPRFRCGTSVACGGGGGVFVNIYLNNSDYAIYVANGNLLSIGMFLYSDTAGNAWNNTLYSKIYDPSNLVVWNISGGQIVSVNTTC
jgi:hypothetical protein